jgi:hypothetical protein
LEDDNVFGLEKFSSYRSFLLTKFSDIFLGEKQNSFPLSPPQGKLSDGPKAPRPSLENNRISSTKLLDMNFK